MNSEIHLFIVWSAANSELTSIISDIKLNLIIKKMYKINWSKNKFSENMSRFYGQHLPIGSDKELHCGTEQFTCVIIEDLKPDYQTRETSRGLENVNVNIFDLKTKYREWTGGGHKIHATNNLKESEHDLFLLLNKDESFFKNISNSSNDFQIYDHNLIGSNGWKNIEDLFNCLNKFSDYLVMRNFECLPSEYTMAEHGDIDLLVANIEEIIYLTNAKKVFSEEYRVHYKIMVNNEEVLFDFRYVGDNYYDDKFEKLLLKEKVLDVNGFYRPTDKLYFINLLYHALVHKPTFSEDYKNRLMILASKLGKDSALLLYEPILLLIDEMDEYQFNLVKPVDLSVHYNQTVTNEFVIYQNLLEIVQSNQDIDKVLANDSRWPILYHLSPIRQNIINWYPFKENSTLLEIGGGCGAITGALCDGVSEVKVVELSKRRSSINYERNKDRENLEIFVGNLNDIKFEDKFDYITLNGVLEYAGSFTDTDEPYKDFLKNIKKFLKPDGKLIIAIENRYGLKYFAGAKEDHTGKEFDSISGYLGNKNVQTFGKKELEELLEVSGYPKQEFYYPHPDYKMPMEIYSENWLPKIEDMLQVAPNYDNDRYELFNETEAFKGIIKNNQYEFFANSFLVICGE